MTADFSALHNRLCADRSADRITNTEYTKTLDAIYAAERQAAENERLQAELAEARQLNDDLSALIVVAEANR